MRVSLIAFMGCFSTKGAVRDVQVTFLHPYIIKAVQALQCPRTDEGRFPQEGIDGLIIALLFTLPLRIIGPCVKQTDAQFSACAFHPVCTELFPIVKIHAVGCSVLEKCLPEAVLHDRLVKGLVEL